jgi:hypothetical protein
MGNQVPNTMWDLTLIYFHENVHKKYIKYTSSTVVQQTTRFCLIVRELGNILEVLGSILINFNNNPKKKSLSDSDFNWKIVVTHYMYD